MQENENIVVMPFSRLTKDMIQGKTREQRRSLKKSPILCSGGKIYINSSLSCKDLLYTYCDAMSKVTTDELRNKLQEVKEKYPGIHEPSQIPQIRDLKSRAEASYIFLIPFEMERRAGFLENLINR